MSTPCPVLLVEDEKDDELLFRRAFKNLGVSDSLLVVSDGEQAINYLLGKGDFADRDHFPLPCYVMLDLKLPRVAGMEVLEWLAKTPELRRIPVVVFTSSNAPAEINRAYDLGANSFILKPVNYGTLVEILGVVHKYWRMVLKAGAG